MRGGYSILKPQQEIHVMAMIVFKYVHFCMSLRPVYDNVPGKNLKSSLPPITCSTSSFARIIHSLYKSNKHTALDKK